jgi:hypothetical protein
VSARRPAGKLAGSVRWAVAPYAPAPPFRIYAAGREPYELPEADPLLDASRQGGDAEFTYLISAKARPVLVLNEPARSEWDEVVALRLRRLSAVSDPQRRDRIRQHEEPLFYHLDPKRFDLPEENAVLIPALVPIGTAAISADEPAGTLNENEMRIVGERLIRHFGFDIRSLVEQRIHELARRRR